MDSVVHLALQEICCEGADGLHLRSLWPKLRPSLAAIGLPLCPNVKRIVWENLVEVPGLQFGTAEHVINKSSVEECDHVKIFAPEPLRKCFLGIFEIEASEYSLSDTQRLILDRLASARKNGIAQNDLTKQLRIPANNLFYQLKKLETQGLIVRQPTVIRKKEAANNGEPKSDSVVTTNMLYLYRYGKHLSSQQRLEITKEDKLLVDRGVADGLTETNDDFGEDIAKGDVRVKDFLPALKTICDKLEKAEGKVLVVSDLKRDLGYRGASGHRSWRNICHRLKDAQVVEECRTVVNKKEVNCLRLLQSFSPSNFDPKFQGCRQNDNDTEQSMTLVKRGLITEQVVELPILRQVYDMIDSEGSKGLTNTEVCRKLGLCGKEYHRRIFNKMFTRFGFHLQAESHDRGVVYRVRTAGNFNPESTKLESSSIAPIAKDLVLQDAIESNSKRLNFDFQENLSQTLQVVDNLASMGDFSNINDSEDVAVITEPSNGMTVSGEGESMQLSLWNPQHPDIEPINTVSDEKLQLVVSDLGTNNATQETNLPAVVSCRRRRSSLNYPCLTVGAINSQREQRILQMLQEEKFLLKPELHRRLESLEREKTTVMDRKTLERSLNKLQREGHCKCIHMSVPALTNCGRSRTIDVILHPSVYSSLPELLGQIHDKQRDFESQLRKPSNFHQKKGQSVPMLDNVQRIPNRIRIDVQSERSEAMRANGFVLAKMVRTKLLHIFIWGWVCSFPGWNDAFLSRNQAHDLKNPHNTYKLFDLDRAIKSMPLKLFLQVVGSAQKLEDMVEKCRRGLRLSDLSMNEYKGLLDTRAIGRLSWLIDILRRLKLIRLVSNGQAEYGSGSGSHTTLTHALEFKPYIEEPVSSIASSGFLFPDLRPQIRHDFVLSTKKTVDEYWDTLEYCYAAVEARAALHAFPGSAVQEVFHSRSWSSVRVMTAGQQAELLKCVAKDDSNRRLSFTECEKIAKDLDLTLEQVLRVHYDKKVRRLTRFQRALDAEGHEVKLIKHKPILPSRKEKKKSDRASSKMLKPTIADGQSSLQMNYDTGNNLEDSEEMDLIDKEDDSSMCIYKCALSSLKQRKRKFSWTEEADRQLVIEYARHRAALGAKFHRLNWVSIPNLPAPPDTCKRRMALLKTSDSSRKALMKLCTLLAERYSEYLKQYQDKSLNCRDSEMMVRDYASVEDGQRSSVLESWKWDDFDANSVKVTLDNVLRHKRMAKMESVKEVFVEQDYMEDGVEDWSKASGRKLGSSHQARKYVKVSNGSKVSRQIHESSAIANAAELFKLIFLSTSTAPEVPALLAETLRHYSEHDLFAAFNYLREKKLMIGGNCNKPFVLSQHFLHSIYFSPFPIDTGKRASKFANWLHEREKDLMEEGLEVPEDLQCGEVLNLCARVSLGELSVTPCLPAEGVGEAEDNRTSKRQMDIGELPGVSLSKKSKTSFVGEGEIISRREKGFPGIKLHLLRETIPRLDFIESFKDDTCAYSFFGAHNQSIASSVADVDCISSHSEIEDQVREIFDSSRSIHLTIDGRESPWEAMTSFAETLVPSCNDDVKNLFLHPESFKILYLAIQKSGDQGLSMKEISRVLNIQDEPVLEIMVEVLEVFGRALKVNGYDCVHVVDSLYRSKYFLTSVAEIRHDYTRLRVQKSKIEKEHTAIDAVHRIDDAVASENVNDMNIDEMHRVTILNQSEDDLDHPTEILSEDKITRHKCFESSQPKRKECRPLLPWMNGDGTVNELVYKGLARRVLGIVMQNPGILESCRKLLEILMMDNHIFTRETRQASSNQPPSILGSLLGDCFTKSKNFFANPASSYLL
ncbi:uncharacterized protein [Henckelia pumila]|uniref:uncharacterized protein isoform X2 n=1 Tax=Henckelia pumila TaxID=405737 RepID=UPI003C6DD12E